MASSPEEGETSSYWEDDWICGAKIKTTSELVEAFVQDASLQGFGGDAKLPAFLVGRLPGTELGTLIFVKKAERWTGYAIEDGGDVQGAYYLPGHGAVVVFSMLSRGGPGNSYTIFSTVDGFRNVRCANVDFPTELNNPDWAGEFLTFKTFNSDVNGAGSLIGCADVTRNDRAFTSWFTYETTDGGASWGQPRKFDEEPPAPRGDYAGLPALDLRELIASLRAGAS